ncbi:MAG: lysophospholipid acyltransferase family protein, partial [Candidatus Hydrogenedentes bacterium]|nr:lysophospholipid acyltransferase family protein [Candidatus Hydrogenedentota bacterium]
PELGIKCAEIVRPLDDPRLNRVVDAARRSTGIHTIPKEGASKELLRFLREKGLVGIMVDQSPRKSAVPVEFFGQSTWGTIGPALAALRANAAVSSVSIYREPDGRYTLEIGPPFETTRTGNVLEDLQTNSQRYQEAAEAMIRKHPDQWLWAHRRWKPRPKLEEEWRARLARAREKAPSPPE